jgi:hypothetical protein
MSMQDVFPGGGAGAFGAEITTRNDRRDDRAAGATPPLAVDPELVEPFTVALNADDAIPELWFDVLLPQFARLDNMTVGVDYTGHPSVTSGRRMLLDLSRDFRPFYYLVRFRSTVIPAATRQIYKTRAAMLLTTIGES